MNGHNLQLNYKVGQAIKLSHKKVISGWLYFNNKDLL